MESGNRWRRKVELWLLNDDITGNKSRYENLEAHKTLFAQTPILVAYVGNKIGDGHNFRQTMDENGNVTASFMDDTAERIVGYFLDENDIRMKVVDGKTWIVGTGYIWEWYARELVQKLQEQGLAGMGVSIETLITKMRMEGTTEVYENYEVLGTTILGEDVQPAVAEANIRLLASMGRSDREKMTLKVASIAEQLTENPQKNDEKGVSKNEMNTKELEQIYNGYKVLSVNDHQIVLLSEDEEVFVSHLTEDGTAGECVSLQSIEEKNMSLNDQLSSITAERDQLNERISSLEKQEMNQRKQAVKDAVNARFAAICETCGNIFDQSICESILTDEKRAFYASMVDENGKFCGDMAACRDLDAACMEQMMKCNNENKEKKFSWENESTSNTGEETNFLSRAIENIMR
jgi:hypothetical protein